MSDTTPNSVPAPVQSNYTPPVGLCAICGRPEGSRETASDHLRTVYVRSGELDPGYYRPRLTDDEMFSVKAAGGREVNVCNNRRACRARRRAKAEGGASNV